MRGFMKMAVITGTLALSGNVSAIPSDFDFSGTFTNDNDIVLLDFSVDSTSTVTIFSSSWLAGDNGLGFDPIEGDTPIVPVVIGETAAAMRLSRELLDEGVFVIGFGFPVVPRGEARIRCQVSAAHEIEHLDRAIAALDKVGKRLGVI